LLFAILIGIATVFMINMNAVNIMDQDSIIEGIIDYRDMSVNRIILTKNDEDEFFVLYDDMLGNLHLCIFEKTKFSLGRSYFASGGSIGGDLGDFYFSEGTSDGHKQLTVAYGKTSSLINGKYEVLMEKESISVEPEDEFYLAVYREETKEPGMIWIAYN
jgi:hypothetical protein